MPDIEVMIGGRSFLVSCQPGEEHFLRSAAAHLDAEAQPLVASMGRLPEVKMLLMAGLMLADRTAAQDDEMRQLRERLAALEDRPEPEPKRVEVPVIPPQVPQTLAELAARVDALADRVGERALAVSRAPITAPPEQGANEIAPEDGAAQDEGDAPESEIGFDFDSPDFREEPDDAGKA